MVKVNYKELTFFKKAHELTLEIYKITKEFPKEEKYGLCSQLQRASSSIGSNIAEGSVRSTVKDYKSFLHNALGSAKEIEYQLLLTKDLEYISPRTYDRLLDILDIIIGSLTNYMKKIDEKLQEKKKN
ncbi:MAG: four helix bundle protein [Nanoarchaeota archaeon]|nr:four helix bundle protein [Nanoarchaeota archaeon]